MEHNRIKRFNENSELDISDVIESKNQTYLLVYMKEIDGDILIETLTQKQIKVDRNSYRGIYEKSY